MDSVRLPNHRTLGKGAGAHADATETSRKCNPAEDLSGDSNNRLGDILSSTTANSNGNGGAKSRKTAQSSDVRSPNGRANGHQDAPDADDPRMVDTDRPVRRIQRRKIGDLKPHPKQDRFFPAQSEEADRELAADMETNGLNVPIDILPDGTILCGHRRVTAAKRLEWKEVDAIVHENLADDEAAAEAFFIDDNYNRRQLTDFQRVRCAVRRVELAKEGKVALPEQCNGLKKTRDKIGSLMGISGREADRYLCVLKAPVEVQHACDAKHLSLVEGGKVKDLPKQTQQRIAQQIKEQGIEKAKAIVKRHLPSKAATRRGAESIVCNLRRALKEATKELPDNINNVGRMDQDDVALIEAAEVLLDDLKEHALRYVDDEDDDDECFYPDIDELVSNT